VKKVEEKKRHERRPSTNVVKQESADKKKEGEGTDKGENLKFAPSNKNRSCVISGFCCSVTLLGRSTG
jgi:hypothetical protein